MNTPLAMTLTTAPTDAWRRALPALLLLLAAILGVYYGTFRSMVLIWERSGTFAHAFVVPPIVLWLIWRQREAVAQVLPRPSPWVLLPFAGLCGAWFLGSLVAINSVTQFAATGLLVLSVPLVLGWRVAMVMLFPLSFLFFAVPFGEFLLPSLMQSTADFTVMALRLSGIPVYREGLQFVIPSGNWSVVEACSGVRYLIASFMVGSLFAYLNYVSWRRRLAFVLVSLLVPIVANWLRAYMIVMLGHLSGNRLAVGVDHLIYGWVFFGIVITAVFMIGARWSEAPREPVAPVQPAEAQSDKPARQWAVVALAVGLCLAPLWLQQRVAAAESPLTPVLEMASPLSPGWNLDNLHEPAWKPAFENPSTESLTRHVDGQGRAVGLYLAYYRQQDESRKLVSSNNVLVKSEDKSWNPVSTTTRTLVLSGRTVQVQETQLLGNVGVTSGDRANMVAWQVYWINGSLTHNDLRAKLLGAWYRLVGRGDESAAIVLHASDSAGRQAAQTLESFLRANLGMIEARLHATRDAR